MTALTITANGTEFNTTTAEQTLTVTATLTKAATEEVSIAIAYDGSSANLIELFKETKAITIAKDATTGTATFPVGKGVEGALKLAFSTTNATVDLKTASLSATFVVDEDPAAPPTFSLARTTTGDIVVPATGDKAETFKVTLSKQSTVEETITLTAAPAGGVLSAASVVFAIGETSKDVTITFQSSVFTSDAVTKDIVVTGASTTLTAKTAAITYTVKGTKIEVDPNSLIFTIGGKSAVEIPLGEQIQYKVTKADGSNPPTTTPLPISFIVTAADGTDITSHEHVVGDNLDIAENGGGGWMVIYIDGVNNDQHFLTVGEVITVKMVCDGMTFSPGKDVVSVTILAPLS